MVRKNRRLIAVGSAVLAVVLLTVLTGCSPSGDERSSLLVFAAASMTDVLGDLEEAFEADGQVDLAFSYGGSQTLAQQIASGAPADMFISAGAFPMRFLADRELVDSTTEIVTNQMVVAVRSSRRPSYRVPGRAGHVQGGADSPGRPRRCPGRTLLAGVADAPRALGGGKVEGGVRARRAGDPGLRGVGQRRRGAGVRHRCQSGPLHTGAGHRAAWQLYADYLSGRPSSRGPGTPGRRTSFWLSF